MALNAGALLLTAGMAATLREGVELALQATRLGRRLSRGSRRFVEVSQWLSRRMLGEIVARKRADVAARLGGVGLADLRARAEPTPAQPRAPRWRGPGARFIMEVKKASPSAARSAPAVDPAAQARAYARRRRRDQRAHRRALFRRLARRSARRCARAFDGPILAKDFVVDPRQVAEARLHGADAVLVDAVGARRRGGARR